MKLGKKTALAMTAGLLAGIVARAALGDASLIEEAANASWSRIITGETWFSPPNGSGTASANQEYKYSSYDSVSSLITACNLSPELKNKYGWTWGKMSPNVNGVVQAKQFVPVTFRVDPEITTVMRDVEQKNYWTSWWFNDNSVVPISTLDNVTMSHVFTTAGTHSVFVLEYYENGYDYPEGSSQGGLFPAAYQHSNPVSCNYITVNVTPDHPPVARIVVSGVTDNMVTYKGQNSSDQDGDDLTYTWRFDDGTVSHAMNVTHTFSNATTVPTAHTAKLTVSDGFMTDVATSSVTVSIPRDIEGCHPAPGLQCQ